MTKFKNFFILSIFSILIIEIISFLIYKIDILEISHKPKIYLKNDEIPNDEWWTEENIWGAWHAKNSKTKQKRSCYNATYISNEVGARDISFSQNSSNDIILIGDSFAEGYGVNLDNTTQKYIEDFTGLNVLNFGVSKNFGIVQYYEIYTNFAKNYKHNKLLIFFLPSNDFGENDYDNWQGSKRYRPYYKKINNNDYEIFIPSKAVKNYKSQTRKVKKVFKDFFWTSGLFINLNYNYKIYRSKKKYGKDKFSGYFDSKQDQQEAAIYFIKKIINEANIDTYLVSIPRLQDFDRLNNGENLQDIFWIKSLNDISKNNKNFTFIDLIKYPIPNLDDLYLKCDGHWTPKGNMWAAEIISKKILKN
tara:strand:- start:975 stop:2060 length:1086 start_codon:yes stop_codon:yes gene_type:complete